MSDKKRTLEVSAWVNNATFSAWFNKLYAMAISCFKWEGFPPSVDVRFLEMCLFWNGWGAYFTDEIMGDLFLPCATAGSLNVYNIPTAVTAYAPQYNNHLSPGTFALCYDNFTRFPLALTMKLYAQTLYEIDLTIKTNAQAQKTPLLIVCDERERLSLENIYMKYTGNQPVIFSSKGFRKEGFQVLKTDAPFVGSELQILKSQIFAEACNALGIEGNTNFKAQMQLNAEIMNTLGSVEAIRDSRLSSREQFADQINRMFGLNVSVKFNSNLFLSKLQQEEQMDVNLYDAT